MALVWGPDSLLNNPSTDPDQWADPKSGCTVGYWNISIQSWGGVLLFRS